jgi:tetratricopeptide (TPR) repeat protein
MFVAYVLDGQFENALECAQELTAFFEKYEIGELLVHVNITLGAAMVASGQMDQGIKIIDEERKTAFENQRNTALAISEFILGMIYSQIATGPKPNLSTMTQNVGFLMKNVPFASKKAEAHFQKCIELTDEIGSHVYRGLSYLELGRLKQARKNSDKARHFIARAIEILEECRAEKHLQKAKEVLISLNV